MDVDRGVADSAYMFLSVTIRHVLLAVRVLIHLCEAKIDHENVASMYAYADEKVVRFDIPMYEALGVKVLQPLKLQE